MGLLSTRNVEPPEAARGKEQILPFSFWRELSAAGSLVLASEIDFGLLTRRTVREQFDLKERAKRTSWQGSVKHFGLWKHV